MIQVAKRPECVALGTPFWPDARNGITTYVRTMRSALRRAGVRVFILSCYVKPTCADEDVLRVEIPGNEPSRWKRRMYRLTHRSGGYRDEWRVYARRALRVIRRLARKESLEIVEMEESFGRVGLVAEGTPLPVVARLHGPWFLNGKALGVPDDDAFRTRVDAERIGLQRVDGISAPSQDVIDRTREYYGLPLRRARMIPNPVPLVAAAERWTADGADPDRVLFVGRFDRHKGGDVMLDAFTRVLRERPATRLTFVGPDRGLLDEDGQTLHLREYLDVRGDPQSRGAIEFPGSLPWEQLAELRRAAAVTVVPSRYENFPGTVMEALAWGSPLVASDAGGIPEIVTDGTNGLLCRAGDAGSLAEAILTLLGDRARAARLGSSGAEHARALYSPDRVAEGLLDFYGSVLAESGSIGVQ